MIAAYCVAPVLVVLVLLAERRERRRLSQLDRPWLDALQRIGEP